MRYWLLAIILLLSACAPTVIQPPAPTLVPSAAPSPSVAPTPSVEPIDLSPYAAAMRSDFVNDRDRFATATQYQIDLTIAPGLASYTGTQRVRYTNTEATPLGVVYFRLFANTSTYGGQVTLNSIKVNGVDVKPGEELGKSPLRIPIEPPLPSGSTCLGCLGHGSGRG